MAERARVMLAPPIQAMLSEKEQGQKPADPQVQQLQMRLKEAEGLLQQAAQEVTIARRAWNLVLEVLALGLLGFVLWFTLAPGGRVSETPAMQKPTLGRIVLYSFLNRENRIVERPAEIVAVWPEKHAHGVNLVVSLDGTNDLGLAGVSEKDVERRSFWATSIAAADDHATAQAGRWRWPPRPKD